MHRLDGLVPLASLIAIALCIAACSSDSHDGPTTPPPTGATIDPTVALGVGRGSACLLNADETVACWGANESGEVGAGDTHAFESLPVVTSGHAFAAISTYDRSTCGLTGAGAVYCWGNLPQSDPTVAATTTSEPTLQSSPVAFKSITVGEFYACGLDAGGVAYCWGLNQFGQLGIGDSSGRSAATRVATSVTFASIEAGFRHTCGLAPSGAAYCWGSNVDGSLGTGDPIGFITGIPAPVQGSLSFTSLSLGAMSTCGVVASGSAYCWGDNSSGEDGTGVSGRSLITQPSLVIGGINFKSIYPSRSNTVGQSTCGVATDGTAYCWGLNHHGQLGSVVQGTCPNFTPDSTGQFPACNVTPAPVPGLPPVAVIIPAIDHSCAITVAKSVVCWGDNSLGQLGDGTATSRATPQPVVGLSRVP